jgi:hypothetical protein
MTNKILLVDSHHGVYCPQIAAERLKGYKAIPQQEDVPEHVLKLFHKNFKDMFQRVLDGPEKEPEFYWSDWSDLCEVCYFVDSENRKWYVHHDEDIWLIAEGHEFDSEESYTII